MKKRYIILGCLGVVALSFLLSGCTISVGNVKLDGLNVIWAPFVAIWNWLWTSFTPGFWQFVEKVWTLPIAVGWLAGIVVNILGAILYIVIVILIILIDLILAILIGIVWFILALLNGVFHFV